MTFIQFLFYILRLIFVPHSPKTMEWKMLRLLNKDRREHGLSRVIMQFDLRKVARAHSLDMARQDYFEHINLNQQSPSDRLKLSRVTETISGENLAKIQEYPNPTLTAEVGLMNSPGHRANILNKNYNCIGIGVVKTENNLYYFTQNFARREIFFTKKIPKTIRLKKRLVLKGKILSKSIKKIIYQIHQFNLLKKQGTIKIYNSNFDHLIQFPCSGKFQVTIFTPSEKTLFKGINQFEIKVKKGWLF